jgi:hypothetical protein
MTEAATSMREKLFTMRMSEDESWRLERVARHHGLNAAATVRMLIKREFDQVAAAGIERLHWQILYALKTTKLASVPRALLQEFGEAYDADEVRAAEADLKRDDYIRSNGKSVVLTAKGRALV